MVALDSAALVTASLGRAEAPAPMPPNKSFATATGEAPPLQQASELPPTEARYNALHDRFQHYLRDQNVRPRTADRFEGASHDFATKRRDLPGVQHLGRWRAPVSVRRFEKSGRSHQQPSLLPGSLHALAIRCGDSAYDVTGGLGSPLVGR